MGAALAVFFIWLIVLSIFFYRLAAHYRRLTSGITKKDLKTVLTNILEKMQGESERVDELLKQTARLKKENLSHIQKIGLVRFNPFAETGGDQSFSLAVLDDYNSGVIISSFHSREATRIYAKPVKEGQPVGYEFSREEKQAIKGAKKIK